MDGPTQTGAPLRMGPLRLAPVPGSELDCWVAHGQVTGETMRLRIMFALCRAVVDVTEGSAVLTHVLDETTGRAQVQCRVTPNILTIEDRIAQGVARASVSRWIPWALRFALRRHRRDVATLIDRHPALTVDPKGIRFGTDPFAASGGGLLLAHDSSRGLLRLTLPAGDGLGLEAHMPMPEAVMHEDATGLAPEAGASFQQQCAPALPLTGRIGREPVTGTLWFDRQWGALDNWLLAEAPRGKVLLGWDRFALRLGPDWHLMLERHHGCPTSTTRAQSTVLFDGAQPIALPQGHVATPTDVWRGPQTGAHYPLQWSVRVPDLELDLLLSPLAQDQELPLPGGWSVWNGAARFDGTLDGHAVTGPARIALHGYAAGSLKRGRMRRR